MDTLARATHSHLHGRNKQVTPYLASSRVATPCDSPSTTSRQPPAGTHRRPFQPQTARDTITSNNTTSTKTKTKTTTPHHNLSITSTHQPPPRINHTLGPTIVHSALTHRTQLLQSPRSHFPHHNDCHHIAIPNLTPQHHRSIDKRHCLRFFVPEKCAMRRLDLHPADARDAMFSYFSPR